ncbi:MAG: zeta toxin family protein [Flavobacteriia bacterium]|nr:zeta toxin family protein [Flavobacteriia bacterium]
MSKSPLLIVIAGPNGSEKTSITSKLLNHDWIENSVYINPDNVANEMFGDWNSIDAIQKAANYCDQLRENCLKENKSIIFETVLSSQEKVEFILKAKQKGYFIRFFFVCTESPIINAGRIANRVLSGGHDVPITKIISRYSKSIANAFHLVSSIDRSYFYDNSYEVKEPKLLFRAQFDKVTKKYRKISDWALPILNNLKNQG